jgi:hypothetical protein
MPPAVSKQELYLLKELAAGRKTFTQVATEGRQFNFPARRLKQLLRQRGNEAAHIQVRLEELTGVSASNLHRSKASGL